MIPVAESKIIICNTYPITAKGKNAQKGLSCHDIETALMGWYHINAGSFALSLDANKSTYG